jgi:hypothetical protein
MGPCEADRPRRSPPWQYGLQGETIPQIVSHENVRQHPSRAIQFSLLPPFHKGGLGGFRDGGLRQIPPHLPLPKGGTEPGHRKLNDPGPKPETVAPARTTTVLASMSVNRRLSSTGYLRQIGAMDGPPSLLPVYRSLSRGVSPPTRSGHSNHQARTVPAALGGWHFGLAMLAEGSAASGQDEEVAMSS